VHTALKSLLFAQPPAVEPGHYRTFVTYNIGVLAAMVVHLAVLPIFASLGATELLWLNLASFSLYLAALLFNRRGHHATAIALCLLELSMHQAACAVVIGWDTGFQYYLWVYPAFALMLPGTRRYVRLILPAVAAVVYMAIASWARDRPPLHPVDPDMQALIGHINTGGVFFLLGVFAHIFRRAADVAEARLAAHERRLADERLTLLRAAVSAAREAILIADAAGRIQFVNEAFCAMSGYGAPEVLGCHVDLLRSEAHPPAYFEALWQTLNAGRPWNGRFINRHKDGSLHTVSSSITPILGENGQPRAFVSIALDVTEADRAAERLQRAEEQLRQAAKMESIGTLAGGVAHDFNNLLTVILGGTGTLRESLATESPLQEEVEEIQKAAERAATLTRQLLAFSRKQVLTVRRLDVNGVVRGIEKLLRRSVSEQVHFVLDLAPDLPPVEADDAQLGQVLLNLAVNAHDAMPDGGRLTIATAAAVFDEAEHIGPFQVPAGAYVELTVRDTGTGIAPDLLQRIFDPFFTTKPVGRGTGLGLSTVYGIVTQLGGHIAVESVVGTGTAFRIFLPAPAASPGATPSPEGTQPPHETKRHRGTVLFVEDDPAVRAVGVRMLGRAGYQVLEAANGAAALECLQIHAGPVDLLVTDVLMPGLDGPALAAEAARLRPGLPALFVSGYPGEVISRYGDFVPGENFLGKPYSADELAALVHRALTAASRAN
jgi:two-component system cell cycle sensor histidine kinase/response regulator CckA